MAKSSTLSLSTYPNPAQDLSVLRFNLSNSARVSAKMTDATGRVVWSQPSAQRNAGQQELMIDTRTLANGVYSVVLTSEVNGEVRVENAKLQVRH